MIRDRIPRAIALCFLAVLIALFFHLPFVIFPSSLLPVYHTRYNADAHSDNHSLPEYDALSGSLQHRPPVSSPPRRAYAHLRRSQNNEDAFQTSITKGWGLRCLMDATLEEAPRMVQNSPKWRTFQMESNFIDPLMAPLEWGWDIRTLDLKEAPQILSDYRVDKMLEFLHVSMDLRYWTQQSVNHEREWYAEDGRTGPVCKLTRPSIRHVKTQAEKNRPSTSHRPLATVHATSPSSTASTATIRMPPSSYWKCTLPSPKSTPCKNSASCPKAKSTHLTCRKLLISCS